ncbi:SPT3 Dosage dependent suppressor of Ty-induced promoter mutations-like protein [Linnemannia exigua]|uniref:SPT3 Dosage dependent suppressor of Ty-induced promoter mutations-like protein n=1 Tax=Linnemannia exigua TaxID=604196 RepID=A0AAD4D2G2_9FUNG|nr:SPT3 Dosage dependent suppressor of Ty-induced promoter mutations-like protein [Linnemannia exigua]
MISHPHSITPTTFLVSSPSTSSASPAPSTSISTPSPSHPSLVALSLTDPPIISPHLQQQQPQQLQQQQLIREQQRQQVQLQQRLLLQQQQQQAQLQLQNLQIRQKKQLLAEQQHRFQQQQQQSLRHKPSLASISPPILVQTGPPPSTTVEPVYSSGPAFSPLKQEPPLQRAAVTTSAPYPSFTHSYLNVTPTTATTDTTTVHTTSVRSNPPNLLRASVPTTASMDIMATAPFPLHQHHSLSSNLLVLQQPIEQLSTLSIQDLQQQQQLLQQQQQQRGGSSQHHSSSQQQQQLHGFGLMDTYFHPLEYESSQGPHPMAMNHPGPGYASQGWVHPGNTMLNSNMSLLNPGSQMLQGMPPSRASTSDAAVMRAGGGPQQELTGYSIDARIIQKKDQMEDSSAGGGSNVVEEVRTGQQFLIKLQLARQAGTPPTSAKYPTMRVDRREAINTAGEPRADVEPLTLQIIVHLARSGQIRRGACAKCCHKYGPSSPILVLLDPLSPSATDTSSYAHVDSSTGSVTVLAKVICSSTDHGERGNKDRYLFEFRLKRTSSMLSRKNTDMRDDDADTVATCFTAPIMCSGHHKAKRVYPNQRPAKVTKEGPIPKTKTIKRQRSVPSVTTPNNGRQMSTDQTDEFLRSGSISSTSSYPSPLSFMHDNITNSSMVSNFGDDQPNDFDSGSNTITSQRSLIGMGDGASEPQSQPPRIFEVRPDRGPIRKSTDVALRGLFFQEGMVPYFGCFPAEDIIVETSNLILCKAPESPLPGTVAITLYDSVGNSFADLNQFTYTDDTETELLILQLQLRLAHRALEYLHTQATGRKGDANDILKEIPGLSSSNLGDGSSSGNMMSDSGPTDELSELIILTREQVEDGLLTTLDQLPAGVDISFQLEDQGSLLHLSVLMGFDRLTLRLIEEGCELDALDAWAMTPLMYAVVKGNETIIRSLVIAGASSSGAKTPGEFYSFLPRPVTPTAAVAGYLAPDMVEIDIDEGSFSIDSASDAEDSTANSPQEPLSTIAEGQTGDDVNNAQSMTLLAERIRGVHLNHDMPPLDQQGLPPMHAIGEDGSITINSKVLKGDEIPRGVTPDRSTRKTDNEESGYHSGVYSEVQDRLLLLNEASLPSAGVAMSVTFKKLMPSSSSSAALSSGPDNLFRTGDSFSIEIRLASVLIPDSAQPQPTLPKEFLGVRFPHEMVKRVGGRPSAILNEMTYILETSIELGQSASPDHSHDHDHAGDGIDLKGACNMCLKFLHEHRSLSPSRISLENPSAYPILQFNVPAPPTEMIQAAEGEAVGAQYASTYRSDVMELIHGQADVRARVNCSSLHHLIQREKARRAAEMSTSSSASAPDLANLKDPGYVFNFRLIHPTLHSVVARCSTGPIMFQSYSRGRS